MSEITDGIFLLDKPKGITSFTAVKKVSRLLGIKKAGHCGTLDPMATGLLPICLGRATKLVEYIQSGDKSYQATLKLGAQTDTGDEEGQVLSEKPVPKLTVSQVSSVLATLVGKQLQTPPMYSALKVEGKKLYEYARQGQSVARKARPIEIFQLTLLKLEEQTLTFEVSCSKGTYVRTLGEEIAVKLGTVGHLTALRRTACAGFSIKDAYSLDALATFNPKQVLRSPLEVFKSWPQLRLTFDQAKAIQNGLNSETFEGVDGEYVLAYEARLFGLATLRGGKILSRKLVEILK